MNTTARFTIIIMIAFIITLTLLNCRSDSIHPVTASIMTNINKCVFSPGNCSEILASSVKANTNESLTDKTDKTDKTVKIIPGKSVYNISSYVEYMEDPEKNLTIKEVSSEEMNERFIPNSSEHINFGLSDSAYWIRFAVEMINPDNLHAAAAPAAQTGDTTWHLDLGSTNIYYAEFYYPAAKLSDNSVFSAHADNTSASPPTADSNPDWFVQEGGSFHPLQPGETVYSKVIFRLPEIPVNPGSQTESAHPYYYLRVESKSSLFLPLTIKSGGAVLKSKTYII